MAIFTASGGDCGGQQLDVPQGQTTITVTYLDDLDRKWTATYELRVVDEDGTQQLVYTGRTKA